MSGSLPEKRDSQSTKQWPAPPRPPLWRRFAPDLGALILLLAIGWAFYMPRVHPFDSRYMYYADVFERVACHIQPEYNGKQYRYHHMENVWPLTVALGAAALATFNHSPDTAVLVLNVGLALTAIALTFIASRLYFPIVTATSLTLLLTCDRALLGLARGLGGMSALLLAPFMLLALYALARLQDRNTRFRRKLGPLMLFAVTVGLLYVLGSHETLYAAVFAAGLLAIFAFTWILQLLRRQERTPRPTGATLLALGLAVSAAAALMLAAWSAIPQKQRKPLWITMQHVQMRRGVKHDLNREWNEMDYKRSDVWRATFVEGRYFDHYGRHHQNTFLYPGPGFNGIIPLFVLPGFVIGLGILARRCWRFVLSRDDPSWSRHWQYLFLLSAVMIGVFLGVAWITMDPKPTRFTPCVLAIYAVSLIGYQRMVCALRDHAARRSWNWLGTGIVIAAVGALGYFQGARLLKNYRDLGLYVEEYRPQILTYGLNTALQERDQECPDCPLWLFPASARHDIRSGPPLGLFLRYERFASKNIHMASSRKELRSTLPEIPENARVYVFGRQGWERYDARP